MGAVMEKEETQCSVFTRSTQMLLLPPPPPKGSPSPLPAALPTFHLGSPCRRRCSAPLPYPCAARGPLLPSGGTQLEQEWVVAGWGAQEEKRSTGGRGDATDRTRRRRRRCVHFHHLLCAPPLLHLSNPSWVPAAPPVSTGRHQEAPRPCFSFPPPPSPPPTHCSPPCLTSCPPPWPRHPLPAGGAACPLLAL